MKYLTLFTALAVVLFFTTPSYAEQFRFTCKANKLKNETDDRLWLRDYRIDTDKKTILFERVYFFGSKDPDVLKKEYLEVYDWRYEEDGRVWIVTQHDSAMNGIIYSLQVFDFYLLKLLSVSIKPNLDSEEWRQMGKQDNYNYTNTPESEKCHKSPL
jgi:hypothetical protein